MHIRVLILLPLLLLWGTHTSAQPKPFDCQASAPHRQFDFWIGHWAVHDPNDTLAGHNTITSVQRGCALEEQWQSIRGGTGQSINYYQSGDDHWRQVWIDAGYSVIDISGGLREGAMVLEGSIHYLNTGKTHPFRGTWTPLEDGRVRQFFQQRDDKGEWQTWFDGYYTRQAAEE